MNKLSILTLNTLHPESLQMNITQHEEYHISPELKAAIHELLQSSFPGFPADRIYYKSLPTFRLLAWKGKELIGQLAVVFRVIKMDSVTARVFGISDVCVHTEHRSKNIATLLLSQLEQRCNEHQIDFLMLIAPNQGLYNKQGFRPVSNTCRWLLINDHQSLGIMRGQLDKGLMVKATGTLKWNQGLLDLMGGVF